MTSVFSYNKLKFGLTAKIFLTSMIAVFMINIAGCYVEKPIIKEIKDVKTPKFSELIEINNIFKNHISIGDDEYTVINTIKDNGFECHISENDINTDNERVYKISYLFENKMIPNNLFVVGKFYFKNEKLIFYKTAYINGTNQRAGEYY